MASRDRLNFRRWTTPIPEAPPSVLRLALRSEEHTSELQSRQYLVCRLLLEKKKKHVCTPRTPLSRMPCSSCQELNQRSKADSGRFPRDQSAFRSTYHSLITRLQIPGFSTPA